MEEEEAFVGDHNEGEMALIIGGGRGLKRCRSRSSSNSNTEDLQEGSEKSVYLLASSGHGLVLYCVNTDDNGYMKRKFCPSCCFEIFPQAAGKPAELERRSRLGLQEITPAKLGCVPHGTIVVSLGSTLYVMGGLTRNLNKKKEFILSRKVFYLDTDRLDMGWMRGPDMLNGRSKAAAVAVEGKIYVFGGNDLVDARDPWSEVLDPIENEWKPLSPPCVYLNTLDLMAFTLGKENNVVVGARKPKYVYHVKTDTWEKHPWMDQCYTHKPAVVGNMLYSIQKGYLYCINMKTERTYSGKIKGSGLTRIVHLLQYEPDLQLLHLGGNVFCYLTLVKMRGDRRKVCCVKFVVSKRLRDPKGGEGTLKASVVSRNSFIVDRPLNIWFWYCHVLDGNTSKVHKEVEEGK